MTRKQALATVKSKSPTVYTKAARKYARKSKADNTIRMYRSAWAEFQRFAEARGVPSLPASPATVIDFITALADGGAKVATMQVKLAAVAWGGKRARALLLSGFAGAFRRSELIGVDVADMHVNGKMTIRVRRSKTDQEGKGITKVIPPIDDAAIDPLRALREWLGAAGIKSGPVFRQIDRWGHVRDARLTSQSVALIVKTAAERAGLEPRQFAGHSLRSGFITEAASAGVEDRDIAAQTGHKSMIVLHGYIQDAGLGAMGAVKAAFGQR